MALSEFSKQRGELQHQMTHYAETIWEAGGDTRLAHDFEVQALLVIEELVRTFRKRIEQHP